MARPFATERLVVVVVCSEKSSVEMILMGKLFRFRGALGWFGILKSGRGMMVGSIFGCCWCSLFWEEL